MRHQSRLAQGWRRRHGLALLALLLIAAACTSDATEEPRAADPAAGAGSSDSFTVVAYQGEEVLGGEEIAFDSLLGQGTPVVLNFWAALCPPCRAEMPWFDSAAQRYEGRVLMVGIDIGPFIGLGTNEQGARLLEDLDISYPAVYAVDDRSLQEFRVLGMPTTVFFNGEGEMLEKHTGILTQQQIDDWFRDLAAGAR